MSKVLYRAISELRSNTESRTITGYAIVFESWSRDLGGFYEIIRKGAITQELINRSDVIMNVNHDNDKMVARSVNGEGTLKLTLDDIGLRFEFDAPPTSLGEELLFPLLILSSIGLNICPIGVERISSCCFRMLSGRFFPVKKNNAVSVK